MENVTENSSGNGMLESKPDHTTDGQTTEKVTDQMTEENTTDRVEDNTQNEEGAVDKKTIASDTGTGLNLVIEYSVGEKIDGFREIHVDVYIESYSLNVTARGNTNYVRVGDETCYFSTDAISYDGTAKKMTHVASHTFTTDTDNATLPIYALWNFNGVYSDKPISAIIVENTINL